MAEMVLGGITSLETGDLKMGKRSGIIYEKGDNDFKAMCETNLAIYAESDTIEDAASQLKDKVRVAIMQGILDDSYKWFLSFDPYERYEDIVVDEIGNLKEFEHLSIADLKSRLSNNRYGLYLSDEAPPEGWPEEVRSFTKQYYRDDNGDSKLGRVVDWFVNRDSNGWRPFCADLLSLQRQTRLGFIFERQSATAGLAYVPVIMISTSLEDKILRASRSWCVRILE